MRSNDSVIAHSFRRKENHSVYTHTPSTGGPCEGFHTYHLTRFTPPAAYRAFRTNGFTPRARDSFHSPAQNVFETSSIPTIKIYDCARRQVCPLRRKKIYSNVPRILFFTANRFT